MGQQMSDIFREVDEEVRREKAAVFWSKYQNAIIALAVLIVAAAGGWRYYQYHTRTASEAAGLEFQDAIALAGAGKSKEAQEAFEKIAKNGPSGYALLAKMRAASEIATRDKPDAIKAFDAIAATATADPVLKQAAQIRAAMLAVDTASLDEMKKRLEPLSKTDSSFRFSALELLAISAMKAKDYDAASGWLDVLVAAPAAPESVRRRANAMQGLIAGSREAKK